MYLHTCLVRFTDRSGSQTQVSRSKWCHRCLNPSNKRCQRCNLRSVPRGFLRTNWFTWPQTSLVLCDSHDAYSRSLNQRIKGCWWLFVLIPWHFGCIWSFNVIYDQHVSILDHPIGVRNCNKSFHVSTQMARTASCIVTHGYLAMVGAVQRKLPVLGSNLEESSTFTLFWCFHKLKQRTAQLHAPAFPQWGLRFHGFRVVNANRIK